MNPNDARESQQESRIASLDGLRAVAIGCVIAAHLQGDRGFPLPPSLLLDALGLLGVNAFFVLSGFLITGLLMREVSRDHTINLRHFYFRRTLRIFPPYYVFIAFVVIVGAVGVWSVSWKDLLYSATYTSNYAWLGEHRLFVGFPLSHSWSLAVEEQFYLVWPASMLLLGLSRARWLPLVIIAGAPIATMLEERAGWGIAGYSFETVSAGLAFGCALALWYSRLSESPVFQVLMRSLWLPFVAVAVAFLRPLTLTLPHSQSLTHSVQLLALTLLLAWCVENPRSVLGRVLNTRPVTYVGRLSYSLYLWQQPFLIRHGNDGWPQPFPINLLLVAAAALLSYYLVERPALRWRARIEERRRARTPEFMASHQAT